MNDFDKRKILGDCGSNYFGAHNSIKDEDIKGYMSITDLLQKNDFTKHIGSFELPSAVKDIMTIDEVNAVISWYLNWKLISPISEQTTCTIKNIFGFDDGLKAIIAINFYKYLRNNGYDPQIVEIFLTKSINKNN